MVGRVGECDRSNLNVVAFGAGFVPDGYPTPALPLPASLSSRHPAHHRRVHIQVSICEHVEHHQIHRRVILGLAQPLPHSSESHTSCRCLWVAEYASGDAAEGHRPHACGLGEVEAGGVAAGQEAGLLMASVLRDGAHRVQHVVAGQAVRGGDLRALQA